VSKRHKDETVYAYRDETGALLYEIVRKKGSEAVRRPDPKNPGKFIWNLGETRRVLYRLHEIHAVHVSETVFFAPDEKQADVLRQNGLMATTNAFGAGHWDDGYGRQLAARPIVIIVTRDPEARDHAERVAVSITDRAQSVRLLQLADGVEAFFKARNTVGDLLNRIVTLSPYVPSSSGPIRVGVYESTSAGVFWYKPTKDGPVRTALTNFNALITHEIEIHDGSGECVRQFEVTATLKGRQVQFSLAAADFGGMNWVPQHLGAEAVIYPANSSEKHTRTAIQLLSAPVRKKRRYTHLGWAEIGGKWLYLHAGGAIGAAACDVNGPEGPTGPHVDDTKDLGGSEILLPESLRRYVLPNPPNGERLKAAIRASLRVLDIAPRRITVPILAAVYRSVLGQGDFALYLVGPIEVRKTELASRGQQHFGPDMDSRHLPGSWTSTANALEMCAFHAKDALITFDDFCPRGTQGDIERLNLLADRIFRGQGNNSGRQRLKADLTLAATKYPRGLVLSTGETVPTGQSLRGRLLIVDVGPDDVNLQQLTLCQQDGQDGLYAETLAAYIHWLAPQYDQARKSLQPAIQLRRPQFKAAGQHSRAPENLAHLAHGFDQFLIFAQSVDAITPARKEELWAEACKALKEADLRQMEYQTTSDPVQMYIDALRAALRSGQAHLVCDDMSHADDPEMWGWAGDFRDNLEPQGEFIGWLDHDDVYLQPENAFKIAKQMAREFGEPLMITQQTLQKRLRQKGMLKSRDHGRDRNVIRKTLNGVTRQTVLHLDSALFRDEAQQAQAAQNSQEEAAHGA
jgi:hypothetical protein